jgi:hypothetical protein
MHHRYPILAVIKRFPVTIQAVRLVKSRKTLNYRNDGVRRGSLVAGVKHSDARVIRDALTAPAERTRRPRSTRGARGAITVPATDVTDGTLGKDDEKHAADQHQHHDEGQKLRPVDATCGGGADGRRGHAGHVARRDDSGL